MVQCSDFGLGVPDGPVVPDSVSGQRKIESTFSLTEVKPVHYSSFFLRLENILANRKRSFIYKYNGYFIPKRNQSPTHLKYKMSIFGILF